MSTKIIILKLTTLLAILSSNRASELTYLDIKNIVFKEKSVIFHFSKLTKTWKKGKSPPSFELMEVWKSRALCNQMSEAISVDYKSFKEWKNNTASHKLHETT